jgi:hypothetical protein
MIKPPQMMLLFYITGEVYTKSGIDSQKGIQQGKLTLEYVGRFLQVNFTLSFQPILLGDRIISRHCFKT